MPSEKPVCRSRRIGAGHGTTDWFQTGKGVHQGCIFSPYLFNLYVQYIIKNAGLDNHNLESGFPEETSTNSDMQMIPL